MPIPSSSDVTLLLRRWSQRDQEALNELVPLMYAELRQLAHHRLRREQANPVLNTLTSAGSSGAARRLDVDNRGFGQFAADWSRDGRFILYVAGGRAIVRSDLWVAPMETPRNARALLESGFIETHGRFAPRGPWFAYSSNETEQLEVYVDRFPDLAAKRRVSTKGGGWPRWGSDGSELFYLSPENQLMTVAVTATSERLDIGVPRPLFSFKPRAPVRLDAYSYDVSPNRQRFIVNAAVEDTAPTALTLVINWTDGLPKK